MWSGCDDIQAKTNRASHVLGLLMPPLQLLGIDAFLVVCPAEAATRALIVAARLAVAAEIAGRVVPAAPLLALAWRRLASGRAAVAVTVVFQVTCAGAAAGYMQGSLRLAAAFLPLLGVRRPRPRLRIARDVGSGWYRCRYRCRYRCGRIGGLHCGGTRVRKTLI